MYIDDCYGFISIERVLTEGRPRESRMKQDFVAKSCEHGVFPLRSNTRLLSFRGRDLFTLPPLPSFSPNSPLGVRLEIPRSS